MRSIVRSALFAGAALLITSLPAAPAAAQDGGAAMASNDPALWSGLSYRMLGPTRGGRVTAVAGHRAHPGTFYMGATGGGVWKTDDWGVTWLPIADDVLTTGSIGAIRVAPSNQSVVYVGTGSDGIRSNVIEGRGMFRSDDGGNSWRAIGLEATGQIGAVEIHPQDPDVAWAAALGDPFGRNPERGVFKTTNGGQSWDRVLFTSDSVGAIDVELHPTNPDIVYAGMWRGERKPWTIISGMQESAQEDGIWRSEDGGATWSYVELGLPSGLIGKIDFGVTPADPDRVYALVETNEPDEGLYRSDDAGLTWRLVSNHQPLMDRPFYYTNVDVDPQDPDVVYVSATQFWKSTDGGENWQRRSTPHGDNHDLWINPDDPTIMVQSNDGGANVTRDGGETWSTQNNQPTAELYSVDVDDQFPRWLYSGQQDNTTIRVPSDAPAESSLAGPEGYWEEAGGCETGPAVPKPGQPHIIYSNCKGRFGRYSELTGQEKQYYVGAANMYGTNPAELEYRFQRVVPIEVSPHNPDVVYHGSQYVHRTRDEGVTWETISPDLTAFSPERQMVSGGPITRDATGEEHYSTLYTIEESPLQEGVIWTGANDGPVYVTRDGGANWTDVSPPMPSDARINIIDPSPHDPATAYVAAFRILMGDDAPYLFKTDDFGATWTRLTSGDNGIPADVPVRVVREDPEHEGLLYAGTEIGIYVSLDDGGSWMSLRQNMPVTPITDLKVVDGDLYVSTMGRSFWMMDNLTPLHQMKDGLDLRTVQLLQPRDAYRERGGGGSFGFGPTAAVRPQNRPNGMMIDYWVPEGGATGGLTLEIVDATGNVVQSYEGGGGNLRTEEGQEMRAPFQRQTGRAGLSTEPGLHRMVWDMSVAIDGGRGPMALPGTYEVRLTSDAGTQAHSAELLMDPRVAADGVTMADLREQYDLILEVNATVQRATDVARRVNAGVDKATGEALTAFEALQDRMQDEEVGSYPKPMLMNQLRYLSGMIGRADQKPGRDAYLRHEQLLVELAEIEEELERLERLIA
ncbi:WD40/YVTN/BNR-like repeat-containing protein [Gaopeijia maritima]|uniref:Sortilin N-terminal domain-containing protein n=1 Tax=Gaopeijia maritima TaxID=3119007 RepID=A0ABU9E3R7_9BACT